MEAAPALPSTPSIDRSRLAAWAGAIALAAIGLFLFARRVSGALPNDLGIIRLAVTVIVAALVVFIGRANWVRAGARASAEELALGWCGSVALWLVCLGCAPPSLHNFAWIIWLPTIALDYLSRSNFLAPYPEQRNVSREGFIAREVIAPGIPPLAPPFEEGEADGQVIQQLTRTRDDAGVESIRGKLRADFAAGQRHATLHVGFCPPLARSPEIELDIADGPDATAKVVQAFPHGARIELRLSEPAEEACSAVVEFVATPIQ